MKEKYNVVDIETLLFRTQDIITASVTPEDPGPENPIDDDF